MEDDGLEGLDEKTLEGYKRVVKKLFEQYRAQPTLPNKGNPAKYWGPNTHHIPAPIQAEMHSVEHYDWYLKAYRDAWEDSGLVTYWRGQLEEGEQNGQKHVQFYFECDPKKRITYWKNNMDYGAHYEVCRNRDHARTYVGKKESALSSNPEEFGLWRSGEKRPSTLQPVVELIRSGSGLNEVAEEHPEVFVRNYRGLRELANALWQPDDRDPELYLLYGPSGSGKSRMARVGRPKSEIWSSPVGNFGWFDGLGRQHKRAILDDFDGRASSYPLNSLLRLLDRYAVQVPVKGGHTWWATPEIYLTTNIHPRNWYDWSGRESQYPALARRFTAVYHWGTKEGSPVVIYNDEKFDTPAYRRGLWEKWWNGPPAPAPPPVMGPMDLYVEHEKKEAYNWFHGLENVVEDDESEEL